MKSFPIVLMFACISAYAEEECIFDETAYMEFISRYIAENGNSQIEPDRRTLIVTRNDESISVKGGGCIHLGMAIELRTKKEYSEEQFLRKALDLSIEFGDWLINTKALKNSIEIGQFQKINGTYFIDVDAMTVFSASYDHQGTINVDFYIN